MGKGVLRLDQMHDELTALGGGRGADVAIEAADLLLDKADSIEESEGAGAALDWYAEVARRLRAANLEGPGAEEALVRQIYAENAMVVSYGESGQLDQAYAAATALVDAHLTSAPVIAGGAVANAAFEVAAADVRSGSPDRALALLEEVIARFGRPEVPEGVRTFTLGNLMAGLALEDLGQRDASLERYERTIRTLAGTDDPEFPEFRRFLAEGMSHKGRVAAELRRPAETDVVYRQLVEQFDPSEGREIAEFLTIANEWFTQRSATSRRSRRRWRRRRT